jgi:outer membrane protein
MALTASQTRMCPAEGADTMMRMTIALALGAVLLAGPASAQTAPPATQKPPVAAPAAPTAPQTAAPKPAPAPVPFPPDAKIGLVNMQFIVDESRLGKVGQEQMAKFAQQKSAEQQLLNKQIQTLESELRTQSSVLAPSVVTTKTAELDKLQRQAQFTQQQAQVDVEALQRQLFDAFSDKVLPLIETLREEKGLWIIFAAGEGTGIVALQKGLDLSAEIVKRLDALK